MMLLPGIAGIHPETEALIAAELEQRSAEAGNRLLCEILTLCVLNLALAHGSRATSEALYQVADEVATFGAPK